jgi:4-hydroxy 2-oxovalerate aldolase
MVISNYTNNELINLINGINSFNPYMVYIVDSYGCLNNIKLMEIYNTFNTKINKNINIGFHLHNNMNNAYSNYEHIKNILNNKSNFNTYNNNREIVFDATFYGMGRGAGNLQTELILLNNIKNNELYTNINKKEIINKKVKNLLIFINNHIKIFYNKNSCNWGYELDFLISGYLEIHPNYVCQLRNSVNISFEHKLNILFKLYEDNNTYFNKDLLNIYI